MKSAKASVGRVGVGAALFAALVGVRALAQQPAPKYPQLPSETPATFQPATDEFDYVRRDVMIPMRDGVKLHTVILVPKGAQPRADPADAHALRRRPAHAPRRTAPTSAPISQGYDNAVDVIVEGGYIRVVQDIRGKYGSEGDYVMNRPLHGPLNPTAGRSRDRHLRHHRLAGEERPRVATARSASSASRTTASCR